MMKRRLLAVSVAVFFTALGLSGCTKKAVRTDASVSMEERAPAPVEAAPAPAAPELVEAAPVTEPLSDIYFDFDRYNVRDDGLSALDKNARLLSADSALTVVVEGHCDERGTEEYNIALGEKRAEAVKKYLTIRGVDSSRIKIVSYGSEKPFCSEHDEQCWQSNRRAHFVTR